MPTSSSLGKTGFEMRGKPQGWRAAQLMMKGIAFKCFRCHQHFDSREEWKQHQDVDPLTHCQERRENMIDNFADNKRYEKNEKYFRHREEALETKGLSPNPNTCKIWQWKPIKCNRPKDNLKAELERNERINCLERNKEEYLN